MKNLIFNIFRTFFFFDLAVIFISLVPDLKIKNTALLQLWREAIPMIIIIVFSYIFYKKTEKGRVTFYINKRKFRSFLRGAISGFMLIFITLLTLKLLKLLSVTNLNKVSFSYLWIFSILFYSITQELLIHGYLYSLYKKYYGITASIIITTLLFISLNIEMFSKGIIYIANMIVFNVLLCLMLEYTKNIVAPISLRFVYNTISTFVFGSFHISDAYPFLFNNSFSGNKYISGGNMKIEGSIILFALCLIYSIYLILKLKARKQRALGYR